MCPDLFHPGYRRMTLGLKCIALALVFTSSVLAAENLVQNPGFEDGAAQPAWWNHFPRDPDDSERMLRDTTTVFRSGKASGLLVNDGGWKNGRAPVQWNRYDVRVKDVSCLDVAYAFRTESLKGSPAPHGELGLHCYDEDGEYLGFRRVRRQAAKPSQWTDVRTKVEIPAGTRRLGVVLYGTKDAKTWYDDVSVTPDREAAARRKALDAWFAPKALNDDDTKPFRVVPATSLRKIPRTEPVPSGEIIDRVSLSAAKDESESVQLIVLPHGKRLDEVTVEIAPPRLGDSTLPITWNRVGYVKTAPPKYGMHVAYTGLWPDILLPPRPFAVEKDTRAPVWFRVDVPPEAAPGLYKGSVTVRAAGHAVTTPITMRVHSFQLPRPGKLATAFGMYGFALAKGYNSKHPYREVVPIEAYAKWCKFFAKRRLTVKNIGRDYIDVKKTKTGYNVDLANLKKTITPLADKYFSPYFFCMHRTPVGNRLLENNGKPDLQAWIDQTVAVRKAWLKAGLPKQTYIYGPDEPRPETYPMLADFYRRLRAAAPGFPIMQTINHTRPAELVGLVDIWCPLTSRAAIDFYQERSVAGEDLWVYVCCSPHPPLANFFVDEPGIDHRILFWQAKKLGATGFLYWCMTWWNGLDVPLTPDSDVVDLTKADTVRRFKVNGDGLLAYPGPDFEPYSSIRLEIIRDGIEDYEMLTLLGEAVRRLEEAAPTDPSTLALLAKAKRLREVPDEITDAKDLTLFTKRPEILLKRRKEVAQMVERLGQQGLPGTDPVEGTPFENAR